MRYQSNQGIRILAVLLMLFNMHCCSSASADNLTSADRKPGHYLSEEHAKLRSRQIKDIKYDISLDLPSEGTDFSGNVKIEFTQLQTGRPLTVDFTNGVIRRITLNDALIDAEYNGWFLTLPANRLQAGKNSLSIDFQHAYSNNGAGLHRSKDPEDGAVYLYTQFEPYDANLMFPCFDQPDLKATYRLRVDAPKEWSVVSSVRESTVNGKGGRHEWIFPESAKFSTYAFSLHAGPFRVWESKAGQIPLRLFARRSLARYVNVEEWFEITQQGFEYFQEYFGIEHPYAKYDQLIVPEFNMGAMENVGAVTFSEFFVKRGKPTADEQEQLAYVILHEMAHMWFGNMVTMRWWNDLWLNESFATLMGYKALAEATKYKNAWHDFHVRSTLWAYEADQMVTTHPIETLVADTLSGFANFDAITYGKGAAVLKQLMYFVEPGNFRRGVSEYLRQHAGGNTRREDFIAALEQASGKKLDTWVELWLRKAGLNSIRPEYKCSNGTLKTLRFKQTAPESLPYLREHNMQVGLFKEENGQLHLFRQQPVTVKGKTSNLRELAGDRCPDLIFPNYGDWAYVKIDYPQADLQAMPARINRLDDPLLRSMLWNVLWESVRDARLPLNFYTDAVLGNLPAETDIKVIRQLLKSSEKSFDYFNSFADTGQPLREYYAPQYENLAWQKVLASSHDQDLQKLWFDHYTAIADTDAARQKLAGLLAGKVSVPGLMIDQDRRWKIIIKLSAHGYRDADRLLERETGHDRSDAGKKAAISARAAVPTMENKRHWLSLIQARNRDMALADLRAAMDDLFAYGQFEFLQPLQQEILAALPELEQRESPQYMKFYARYLLQGFCQPESIGLLTTAIDKNPDATPFVSKQLKIARQEDQRCLAMLKLIKN